jgi:hypothetical protein
MKKIIDTHFLSIVPFCQNPIIFISKEGNSSSLTFFDYHIWKDFTYIEFESVSFISIFRNCRHPKFKNLFFFSVSKYRNSPKNFLPDLEDEKIVYQTGTFVR